MKQLPKWSIFTALTVVLFTTGILTLLAVNNRGSSPVAWWKFDEGYSTIAYDAAGSNDGTINGPVWKQEDDCKSGKCLYFDGSNDYVFTGSSFGLSSGSSITVSAWINATTVSGAPDISNLAQWDGGPWDGWRFRLSGSGVYWKVGDGTSNAHSTAGGSTITVGTWHHVVGTYDGSYLRAYIDGVSVASTADTFTFSPTTGHYIGMYPGGAYYFPGSVDDVRIYNYARTAAQIKADYAGAAGGRGAAVSTPPMAEVRDASEGLVGYWKFDETALNQCAAAQDACDAAGMSNNLAAIADAAPTSTAKFGYAARFDGTGDYYCSDPDNDGACEDDDDLDVANQITVEAWIKTAGSADYAAIVQKWEQTGNQGGYQLLINATNVATFCVGSGAMAYSCIAGTTNVETSSWLHVVATYDNANIRIYVNGVLEGTQTYVGGLGATDEEFLIGYDDFSAARVFTGQIDDVKIYNTARSASQIRRDYESGPGPVAYWKMDEKTGDTAYDTSGNANNGDLYGACPGAATCPTWTQGKYGNALQFDGSNDYVNAGQGSSLNGLASVTLSAWIKPYGYSASYRSGIISRRKGSGAYEGLNFTMEGALETPYKINVREAGGGGVHSNTVISPNQWSFVTATLSGTNAKIYINGFLDASGTVSWNWSSDADVLIGLVYPGYYGYAFNGLIDDARVYNYARTPKQIMEDLNAGHPAVGSPVGSYVGYWKLDEGYGQTAYDESVNNLDGTLGASTASSTNDPAWTTAGKYGNALSFDESDYVRVASSNSFAFGTGDFTWGVWVNSASFASGNNYVLDFGSNGGVIQYYSGILRYYNPTTGQGSVLYTGPATLNTNIWYYITIVRFSGITTMYINGVAIKSAADTHNYAAQTLTFGDYGGGGAYSWDGQLDEVKIYPFALTPDEIKQEYNKSASFRLGSVSTESDGATASNSTAREYCVPGDTTSCDVPVAHWKMDEKDGQYVYDVSGAYDGVRGATSTAGADDPTWKSLGYCHDGSCLEFDGTDDYVDINGNPDLLRGSRTYSLWFYPHFNSDSVVMQFMFASNVSGDAGSDITLYSAGNGFYGVAYKAGGSANYVSAGSFMANNWYHIVATFDDNTNEIKVYHNGALKNEDTESNAMTAGTVTTRIGSSGLYGYPFDGLIDDVRVYNYARSQAQIAWDYNRGKPIAQWDMNEGQDTSTTCNATTATVYDAIGSNDGTLTLGASPTIANARVEGKYGCAVDFDGTDDYVSVSAISFASTSAWSINMWFLAHNSNYNPLIGYQSYCPSVHLLDTGISFRDSDAAMHSLININDISLQQWHHLTLVASGAGSLKAYLDGVLKSDSSFSNTAMIIDKIGGYIWMGNDPQYSDGMIDDTRVYNYPLTAKQIEILYNEGSAVRFGPEEGLP